MDQLISGGDVLFLWDETAQAALENTVNELRSLPGVSGVKVEQHQQFNSASYANSTFNTIVATSVAALTDAILPVALAKLKPAGRLVVLRSQDAEDELKSRLVLGGFVNARVQNGSVLVDKPNYETGSAAKLSFGSRLAEQKAKVAAVWTISNDDDDVADVIDADDLLDEEDLAKPDPSSNRVCGTTGKRKACKDCSCGLADELSAESKPKADPNAKSSCGSCYLGDAFRCGSCPYMGMPAFKPGEKIQLNDNFLGSA